MLKMTQSRVVMCMTTPPTQSGRTNEKNIYVQNCKTNQGQINIYRFRNIKHILHHELEVS